MSKFKKIMAGIGLATIIGGCGIMATGCADMTDAQIKDALDTATKAETTLEELKDLMEKQNADYVEQNEKYQQLLEEKNAIIEKLANDKSKTLTAEEAIKLLNKAQMDFELMSSGTNNISCEFKGNNGVVGEMNIFKKSDETYTFAFWQTYKSQDSLNALYYYGYGNPHINQTNPSYTLYSETKDSSSAILDSQKSVQNQNIYSFMSRNLNPFGQMGIQASDILQAKVQEDGTIRIVCVMVEEDDYNTKSMYNVLLDNDGKFLSIERNLLQTNPYDSKIVYPQYMSISYTYGELTEEWANEQIEFVDSHEEATE